MFILLQIGPSSSFSSRSSQSPLVRGLSMAPPPGLSPRKPQRAEEPFVDKGTQDKASKSQLKQDITKFLDDIKLMTKTVEGRHRRVNDFRVILSQEGNPDVERNRTANEHGLQEAQELYKRDKEGLEQLKEKLIELLEEYYGEKMTDEKKKQVEEWLGYYINGANNADAEANIDGKIDVEDLLYVYENGFNRSTD